MLAQKMHVVKVAVIEADKIAAVSHLFHSLQISAKYTFSPVPEIRVE